MVRTLKQLPQWRLLNLSYESAFKNLALEETLARTTGSKSFLPTIRVWSNVPAAVLGRFQEASSEVDLDLCESRKVQVARRFTGGGAVFHDEGTLNFTIVTEPTLWLSVGKLHEIYSDFIINSLKALNLNCSFSPPNSILVDGGKVCGAAAALGNHFALWHCSILVSTDTRLLEEILAPSRRKVSTRFVRSHWKPVTTIEAQLGAKAGLQEVRSSLLRSFATGVKATLVEGGLTPDEEGYLRVLLSRKYSSAEWNLNGNRFRVESKESGE
jgi:lipoate-protein ligase A